MMAAQSGVYKIENLANGKVYVGSAADIEGRWANHKYKLRNDKHTRHLQAAWGKYGESNFKFEILELVEDTTQLVEVEAKWVEVFNANNPCYGYNTRVVAQSNLGVKHTDMARAKISTAFKGKPKSPEHMAKTAMSLAKDYIVTDPNGQKVLIHNLQRFCRERGLSAGAMCSVADGKRVHHRGWKCQRIGPKRELPKRRVR